MAEPTEQSDDAHPELLIELRFTEDSRFLYLFVEDPESRYDLPEEAVLRQIEIRLTGTAPATHRAAARAVDIPYRVADVGRIPRRAGTPPGHRIMTIAPLSELAIAGEARIRRGGAGSSCVQRIHLHWPDGRRDVYARRPGHKLVFRRTTSS